jgi:hypothetical protein
MHLARDVRIVFAVPDHPWVESADGADVRVAMTVARPSDIEHRAQLCRVVRETATDSEPVIELECSTTSVINSSLSGGINARSPVPLAANAGMCFQGVVPAGGGFKVEPSTARDLSAHNSELIPVLRPYVIGRDLVQSPSTRYIIDLFGLSENDVRTRWPRVYQHLTDRVLPERAQNRRSSYREKWWLFAEPRPAMRKALAGLSRYVGTPYTAKHRPFIFLDSNIVPDAMVYAIASADAFVLGALSSRIHVVWALAAGGRLGIGNDPRYTSNATFLPFPFPDPDEAATQRIRDLGEQLDAHRKRQQAIHPDLTITGMYNVLEKLRSGEDLTTKEKKIHEDGLVSVLKQIHDDLDAAVFDAYGWPHDLSDEMILERLVALNAERAEEERRGLVRWLRPEFQNPAGAPAPAERQESIALGEPSVPKAAASPAAAWPKELPRQIAAVRDLVSTTRAQDGWSAAETARAFRGARTKDVKPVLDSLAAVGLLVAFDTTHGRRWQASV